MVSGNLTAQVLRGNTVLMSTVVEFDGYYRKNCKDVVGYFVSFGMEREVAEDLAQDVFCRVLAKLGDVRELGGYVWRCVGNRLVSYFRERAVRRVVEGYSDGLLAMDPWSVEPRYRCRCGAYLPVSGVCGRCGRT